MGTAEHREGAGTQYDYDELSNPSPKIRILQWKDKEGNLHLEAFFPNETISHENLCEMEHGVKYLSDIKVAEFSLNDPKGLGLSINDASLEESRELLTLLKSIKLYDVPLEVILRLIIKNTCDAMLKLNMPQD